MANELERLVDKLRAEGLRTRERGHSNYAAIFTSIANELDAALQQAQQPGAQAVAIEPEPDLDAHDPKSGELVAQWLFRNGFHELAAVVRAQLDMRAPRKAPPPLPEGVSDADKALAYYRAGLEHGVPAYVPARIRLQRGVRGDPPIGHATSAPAGDYDCECNRYGAVSVRATNGKMLGIKPAEFEVLEWRENDRARLAARGEKGVQGG